MRHIIPLFVLDVYIPTVISEPVYCPGVNVWGLGIVITTS